MFKPIIIGNFEEFKLYKTLIRVKVSADTGLSAATTRRISLFGSILIYFLEKQAIVKDNCRHIWNKLEKKMVSKKLYPFGCRLQPTLADFACSSAVKRFWLYRYYMLDSELTWTQEHA